MRGSECGVNNRSVLTALPGWIWPISPMLKSPISCGLEILNKGVRTPYENFQFFEIHFVRGWRIDRTSKLHTAHFLVVIYTIQPTCARSQFKNLEFHFLKGHPDPPQYFHFVQRVHGPCSFTYQNMNSVAPLERLLCN